MMGTKFVIHPARGLPPARTPITNFVLSLFSGLDMLYIYIICIYIYMSIGVCISIGCYISIGCDVSIGGNISICLKYI